jgi:uncharacterized protein involved in type VI secretion and phage assembly
MKAKQPRHFGKYRGTVVNTLDPQRLARLQAIVPDIFGTQPTSWAMPAVPFAGAGAGFLALPPVGSGVWIEFEQGDPDYPIWTGCWWGSPSEVPTVVPVGQPGVDQAAVVTRGRHALVISDLPGPAGGVVVSTPSGARIAVTDTGIIIDNGKGASIALTGNTVRITGVMI